ncbi:MAG: lysylphosphatidylglycerol synthase transmembrane domain-containing protein, partial [Bacteroidales bacterium]|nr:lysylphosphatidylglycerol synthase transmembrane domain-containing protein [Bacteroidales bacterium]
MKNNILSVLKYLVFLLIGLLLLWLALRGLNFEKIWSEFRAARYSWLLMAMIPGFISHISRAARWNIMIESMGYKTRLFSTFHAVMMGYFANMAVPRLGEITRCTVLSRRDNIPLNGLIGTVIAERLFDTLCLGIIAFLVIIGQFSFLQNFLRKVFWSPLSENLPTGAGLITVLAISIFGGIFLFWLLLKFSMPFIRRLSFYKKMKDLLLGFAAGIKTIKNLKHKRAFLFHTLLIWFMYFLMTYIPFRALQATSHLTLLDATTLLMMGTFAMVVPVPAGIGAYHWIITKTLTDVYNIASEPAASFALMAHAAQI